MNCSEYRKSIFVPQQKNSTPTACFQNQFESLHLINAFCGNYFGLVFSLRNFSQQCFIQKLFLTKSDSYLGNSPLTRSNNSSVKEVIDSKNKKHSNVIRQSATKFSRFSRCLHFLKRSSLIC